MLQPPRQRVQEFKHKLRTRFLLCMRTVHAVDSCILYLYVCTSNSRLLPCQAPDSQVSAPLLCLPLLELHAIPLFDFLGLQLYSLPIDEYAFTLVWLWSLPCADFCRELRDRLPISTLQ